MRALCVGLLLLGPLWAMAQDLKSFTYLGDVYQKEDYLSVSILRTQLWNPAAPDDPSIHARGVNFLDAYYHRPNFEKWGLNRRVDYKLLPDMFWLFKTITEKDEREMYAKAGSSITGGIIGWHSWNWNVRVRSRSCVQAGFALNDYFIGAIYQKSGGIVLNEPQGWQIGAGPSGGYTCLLSKNFLLTGTCQYILSFAKPVDVSYAKADNNYPKPHFWHTQITLMSKWGGFAEVQYVRLLNRGNLPNSTQRLDLKLGFAFVL
jgi:hypothetical protein